MIVEYVRYSGLFLTIGKFYDVELYGDDYFSVINDNGIQQYVKKHFFDYASELRNKKLEELGI